MITDIDLCLSSPCDNGGTCTDHGSTISCLCPPGYTGVNCHTGISQDSLIYIFCRPLIGLLCDITLSILSSVLHYSIGAVGGSW